MRITSFLVGSLLLAGLPVYAQEQPADANAPAAEAVPAAETAPAPEQSAPSYSKIRIVRLSEVKGEVQLDRNTGKGFETPMANLPIVEGNRLKTGTGVAEVELEDNSTVRVAPDSLIEFPRLELKPGGIRASSIRVVQGMVYVSIVKAKGNEFALLFGKQSIQLPPDSHVRLQLTASGAEVAVLHGDALVSQSAGVTTVGKNKTMTFDLANGGEPLVAKNVAELPTDAWDHDAVEYHKSFANASAFGNTPYAYGVNDMNYYGSFINAAGCGGSMWRPYFASAAWDPYGNGAWAYYPSAGYSWVSPYPWGWMPFHSGSWSYCEGTGWGWRSGGPWIGIANSSFIPVTNSLRASNSNTFTHPRPPQRPPMAAQSSLVPVNSKAIPVSTIGKENNFVFRSNSAGFGVPRGSLGKLSSFSGQVASHGAATTNVFVSSGHSMAAGSGSPSVARGLGNSGASSSHTGPTGMSSHASSPSAGGGGGGMSHASSGGGGGGRR